MDKVDMEIIVEVAGVINGRRAQNKETERPENNFDCVLEDIRRYGNLSQRITGQGKGVGAWNEDLIGIFWLCPCCKGHRLLDEVELSDKWRSKGVSTFYYKCFSSLNDKEDDICIYCEERIMS
jgi:hypothetical protein